MKRVTLIVAVLGCVISILNGHWDAVAFAAALALSVLPDIVAESVRANDTRPRDAVSVPHPRRG